MSGKDWLGKQLRIFAGYDRAKQYSPMAEGEVIAYIDGPSVIVRNADGTTDAWPISLPMEQV